MKKILYYTFFISVFFLLASCTESENEEAYRAEELESKNDYMLGKWKATFSDFELWINRDYIVVAVPDHKILSEGKELEVSGLCLIYRYKIKHNMIVGDNDQPLEFFQNAPLPIKFSADTIGYSTKGKIQKFYRVRREIPEIENSEAFKENILIELNTRRTD